MRSSLNIYLAGLSVFDFLLLAMSVMIYPLMETCLQQGDRGDVCHIFWYTSVFTYPVSLIAQTGSVWTCVAITLDRFLAVKYPLHMRLWCTSKRAIWVLSFITAFSIIYKIPSFFELSHDECGRVTATSLRNHPLYIVLYITYGNVFILLLIPWLIIIILNVVTVNAVRAAYKMRCQLRMNQRTEDNDRMTKMATVTIVAFILFNSIAGFTQIIEGFSLKIPGQQYFLTVGNFLVCLNSASNILIYSIFGRRFRKMAFNLVCPCISAHYQPLGRHLENKTQVSAI
uniref:G-protein coupled receptors family 1 profile domain-containing protein n=1 Tax=Panagrolaimus sp. JU765 TaxID=591449 RepID=A0AC34QHG2_9BILA